MSTAPAPSLRAFMTRLIDYAGLFPPAKLPLDEAIAHYHRYRHDPDAWMLARFIIPAGRLSALTTLVQERQTGYLNGRAVFSVLGPGGQNLEAFTQSLRADVQAVKDFRRTHGEQAVLDVFETRLPESDDAEEAVRRASDLLLAAGLRPFYEVPADPGWEQRAAAVIEAVALYNHSSPSDDAGFKLRCGGIEASVFPSLERVAFAIDACREAGVPLKATAGLHHPIRRFNEEVQTGMHGFVNLFGAGILAHTHALNRQAVQSILEDEDAGHFSFTDASFSWQGLQATTERIAEARRRAIISYGSCSFDEPREDLRALGWL